MSDHYREHRVRTSLQGRLGLSPTEPEVIERLVRRAREVGVVVFLKDELDRMPVISRELILAEARRLRERGR